MEYRVDGDAPGVAPLGTARLLNVHAEVVHLLFGRNPQIDKTEIRGLQQFRFFGHVSPFDSFERSWSSIDLFTHVGCGYRSKINIGSAVQFYRISGDARMGTTTEWLIICCEVLPRRSH